jgi:hypothetical protein
MSKSDDTDDTNYFSVSKYGRDKGIVQDTYVDMTDAYANYGQYVISFQHLATKRTVFFKAFVKDYSEAFNASWTPTSVYGRTDPIQTYTGTTRKVTLAFDVPAASVGEAYENMGRVSKLVQMLYPTYIPNDESTGRIIGQAPLVRVKMMNLLTRERTYQDIGVGATVTEQEQVIERSLGMSSPQDTIEAYRTSPLPENGVLAAIGNVSYKSDLSKIQIFEKGPNTVLPQSVTVSLSFDVIHEETIGWDSNSKYPLARSAPHKITMSDADNMKQVGNNQSPADIETRMAQEERNQASDDQRVAQSDAFFNLLSGRGNKE